MLSNFAENKTITKVFKTEQLNSKYSLLVFYQSDCGHCETVMAGLKSNYQVLNSKGVKIITMSADIDLETYKTNEVKFPWKDTYCNFDGISGVNFMNYAVIGTPTIFLLDSKGIIVEKIISVEQLMAWIKDK